MTEPRSPRLIHKAAVDSLLVELQDTFRGKEEPPDGGEPQWPSTFIPMKKDADAPAIVCDFSSRRGLERLSKHIRRMPAAPSVVSSVALWHPTLRKALGL